ncbi:hypothetical protein ACVMB2_002057 [Sinorhizobium meliloti]
MIASLRLFRNLGLIPGAILAGGTLRRLPPPFGLAASCGIIGTGSALPVRQRNRFEIHIRWHSRPSGWRLLFGRFAVFGITHGRSPFVSRLQPPAFSKVPRNSESA